jgi:hypothetical protein
MTKCDTCDLERIFLWRLKNYNFYKCNKCSLIYADVNKNDLDNACEADYYRMVYPDYEADRNIHHLNSDIILSEIEKYFKVGTSNLMFFYFNDTASELFEGYREVYPKDLNMKSS